MPVLVVARHAGVAEINAQIRRLMDAPTSPERTDRYVRLLEEWAEAVGCHRTLTVRR
jgi:hypothetical protein